jgi:hypothetical protein
MRKTLILLIAFFGAITSAKAQNWGGGVDEKDIHFGFTFQVLSSEYKVLKKPDWRDPYYDLTLNPPGEPIHNGIRSIYSQGKVGYGLGFVVNKRVTSHTDLRLTPTLVFNDRILNYQFLDPGPIKQQVVQTTLIDLPLGFKLKSDRRKNFRAYMIGGLKYSMDITSAKKRSNDGKTAMEMLLQNKKNFLSYEAGLGMDLYFEYFKMSPEIKYSSSFNSILEHDNNNPYSNPLNKVMLRHVTFSLFFE